MPPHQLKARRDIGWKSPIVFVITTISEVRGRHDQLPREEEFNQMVQKPMESMECYLVPTLGAHGTQVVCCLPRSSLGQGRFQEALWWDMGRQHEVQAQDWSTRITLTVLYLNVHKPTCHLHSQQPIFVLCKSWKKCQVGCRRLVSQIWTSGSSSGAAPTTITEDHYVQGLGLMRHLVNSMCVGMGEEESEGQRAHPKEKPNPEPTLWSHSGLRVTLPDDTSFQHPRHGKGWGLDNSEEHLKCKKNDQHVQQSGKTLQRAHVSVGTEIKLDLLWKAFGSNCQS